MNSGKRHKRILGKLILPSNERSKKHPSANEFDATRPAVLFWLSVAYVGIVFFLILGIPLPRLARDPVPPEDVPVAAAAVVIFI
jgi:hypothetical protein